MAKDQLRPGEPMGSFCRDCLADVPDAAARCAACGSPRLARHPELARLAIAHVDCDAFYAAIEKRDDPSLRDKPVIVGGGHRGVVATACYIARTFGVRSAMPMFEARRLCPHAEVVRPDMAKYARAGREVRAMMLDLTPLMQRADEATLMRRFGTEGLRLARLSRGIDARAVNPERETKSVSAETTLHEDLAALRPLERHLWELTEKVSARLKAKELAGATVTLKLKSSDFRLRTRARSLAAPTQLAAKIFTAGRELLARETDGTKFRLIGIGVSALAGAAEADPADLVDVGGQRSAAAEHAVDRLRAKFGRDAVIRGIALEDGEPE
jgi:nucleotidyltransferase/DNA polymerase involved in DNA repair